MTGAKRPWSVPIRLDEVPEAGLHVDIAADGGVRAAVAATAGEEQLAAVLARNIFPASAAASACAQRLGRYVRAAIEMLDRQEAATFSQARISFPDPDLIAAPA